MVCYPVWILLRSNYLPSQNPPKSDKKLGGRHSSPDWPAQTHWSFGYRGSLSTFENRFDKKGRLSVPAPFRSVLERRSDPLYLFKSLTEPCLEGCGPERIGQIVDAIDTMDSLSAEVATLQTMLSSAQEMKVDSEGRIMLNTDFIAFAELDDPRFMRALDGPFRSGCQANTADARLKLAPAQKPAAFQACAWAS